MVDCEVQEDLHTNPKEDHGKFKGGGGFQKLKFLKESMKAFWNSGWWWGSN